jgi:hypothetical protein
MPELFRRLAVGQVFDLLMTLFAGYSSMVMRQSVKVDIHEADEMFVFSWGMTFQRAG